MRTIRPTHALTPEPNRGAVHARLTRNPIPWARDLQHTAYVVEADGFTRETHAGHGWQDRIRTIVSELRLQPGTEVRIYRKYGQTRPGSGEAGHIGHEVRRVTVPVRPQERTDRPGVAR